jgi:hypothetical protein
MEEDGRPTYGKHRRRDSAAPLDRFVVALDYRDVGPSDQFMVVGAGDYLSSGSDVMSTALKRSVRKTRIGAT